MSLEQTGFSGVITDARSGEDASARNHLLAAIRCPSRVRWFLPIVLVALFGTSILQRIDLDQRDAREFASGENLALLPSGEYLKPLVVGHAELAADLVWLEFVQVLGSDDVREQDYQWMRHALDVVTTLDPQFVEAYDLGAVVLAELGKRVDWSNALLEKGMTANPVAWRLPFLLGFNHFFYLHDYGRAAMFLSKAARLPGSPAYVPELAARLYVQADRPETALVFLETMQRESKDPSIAIALERRRKEVLIERDILRIEQSLQHHMAAYGALPSSLEQLVDRGWLRALPVEPFGGSYHLDSRTGLVTSTTHPQRLRMFGHGHGQQLASWGSPP